MKIGPVDTEMALLIVKKKKKKLRKIKYIARSAGLPSGLKMRGIEEMVKEQSGLELLGSYVHPN